VGQVHKLVRGGKEQGKVVAERGGRGRYFPSDRKKKGGRAGGKKKREQPDRESKKRGSVDELNKGKGVGLGGIRANTR